MQIKERNIVVVYLLSIITFGIYLLYWFAKTKDEMNENFGASVPTAILLIIPIANIYWTYKYAEAFSEKVKKDNNAILWALLFILVGIITPAIVQSELNKYAGSSPQATTQSSASDRRCPNCGRVIPNDAKVCPYCKKDFQDHN